MASSNGHVSFIWSIAELLRGDFKRSEYGRVVLPFTLLRRLDLVLEPTKQDVLEAAARYDGRGLDLDRLLKQASGELFYNTSNKTLETVYSDAENVAGHLVRYVAGFDPIVRDVFAAFGFEATIARLHRAGLLYKVLGRFLAPQLDMDPATVSNAAMGDIFEELIRRFSEVSNETAGEHFTPREVVRLCAELVLIGDERSAETPGFIRSVYDPACGTGGMLSVTEELVRERHPGEPLYLFGQEINPESWAICRAEMLLKDQDPSMIAPRSTLSADGHAGSRFDYMLANPPFGVDWSKDHEDVLREHEELGFGGRFGAGLPRKSDGALLFLQHMLTKMKPPDQDHGSRIAIVFNASPLFTGGPASGESEIRRWIIENDWLEAIVALPEQLFYNTGIATYVWVLSDRKQERRRGKVQLIDARDLWELMPRSLGNKRRRLSDDHIARILQAWHDFEAHGELSRVRENASFGYRRIKVERPLRLRYRGGEEAVTALLEQRAFLKLADPPKRATDPEAARDAGERLQRQLVDGLRGLGGLETIDRALVERKLEALFAEVGQLSAITKRLVWEAVSERDPEAPPVLSADGAPRPDPYLRDYEDVPLGETTEDYLAREILPYADDAWVVESEGAVPGYAIPFKSLFFEYSPPRDLADIDSDIRGAEDAARELLEDVVS